MIYHREWGLDYFFSMFWQFIFAFWVYFEYVEESRISMAYMQLHVKCESFSKLRAITDSLWFPLFSFLAIIWVCFSPQSLQDEVICESKEDRTKYIFVLKVLQLSYQLIRSLEKHLMHTRGLKQVSFRVRHHEISLLCLLFYLDYYICLGIEYILSLFFVPFCFTRSLSSVCAW